MKIRKATKDDIPFIVDAILEIEKTHDSDTFSNLFESEKEVTKNYLQTFFKDVESLNTELSLNTYIIAEIKNEVVGCCSLIFTDSNYYQNKGELFPIHLKPNHLTNFIEKVKSLPNSKGISENKYFIEYIFTKPEFRGQRIAKTLIDFQIEKIKGEKAFLNVLENNLNAIKSYKNMGFEDFATLSIDNAENKIYPSKTKLVLVKN